MGIFRVTAPEPAGCGLFQKHEQAGDGEAEFFFVVVRRRNTERIDEARMNLRLRECTTARDTFQQGKIGGQPGDAAIVERVPQSSHGIITIGSVHDKLGDHGIVVNADAIAFAHAGVDAKSVVDGGHLQAQ